MTESESEREAQLVDKVRAGDQDAARQIYDRYLERLLALAQRRLSQRFASRVDPEDVLQSVFRSFFLRMRDGQFTVEGEDDLTKVLVQITIHKTLRQIAFHQAERRSTQRECSQGAESREQGLQMPDREPTPEEAILFLDQLEHFLKQLQPQERQIVELRVQGYGTEEIASRLGTYDRKVRRVLERVRGLAEREGFSEP